MIRSPGVLLLTSGFPLEFTLDLIGGGNDNEEPRMQTSTKIFIGLVVLVLIIIGVVATSHSVSPSTETIKIGVLSPLTGPAPILGEWMLEGNRLAAAEINANGDIQGKQIELVIEDDACSGKAGVSAYKKLHAEGIAYFVGPLCGAARIPILQAAEGDGALLMTTGLALSERVRKTNEDQPGLGRPSRFPRTRPSLDATLAHPPAVPPLCEHLPAELP